MSPYTWLLCRLSQSSPPAQRLLLKHLPRTPSRSQRPLSTSFRQHAAKGSKLPPKPPKYSPKPTKAPASNAYKPFTQTLAERSEPILLYQGASNTVYKLGCYSIALLMYGWTIHSANQIYRYPPPYFNRFLTSMYYGVCGIVIYMGTLFIMKTIQTLPVYHKGTRTLHLQLESARLLPGLRPRTVSVPATDVTLSQQLHVDKYSGVPAYVLELRHRLAQREQQLRDGNVMSLPFRQLNFHLWKGFQALKGVFARNPFIYLRAKGYNASWKLGREAGWALDEGRAIDRVVKSRVTA